MKWIKHVCMYIKIHMYTNVHVHITNSIVTSVTFGELFPCATNSETVNFFSVMKDIASVHTHRRSQVLWLGIATIVCIKYALIAMMKHFQITLILQLVIFSIFVFYRYSTIHVFYISVLIKKKNRTFKFQQDWLNFFQQNNWSDLFPLRILVSRCFVYCVPRKESKMSQDWRFAKDVQRICDEIFNEYNFFNYCCSYLLFLGLLFLFNSMAQKFYTSWIQAPKFLFCRYMLVDDTKLPIRRWSIDPRFP